MIFGADVSHYQGKIDYDLWKMRGVEFVAAKATEGAGPNKPFFLDNTYKTNAHNAIWDGLLFFAYHWDDPWQNPKVQVDRFLSVATEASAYILDQEQYWIRMEWETNLLGKKVLKKVGRYDAQRLSDHYQETAEYLRDQVGSTVLIYSASWFLKNYSRPMLKWLPRFKTMLASYPTVWTPKGTKVTWESYQKKYAPKKFSPLLLPGMVKPLLWQCTGDWFVMEGVSPLEAGQRPAPLDVDVYDGSKEDLLYELGLE